MHRSAVRSWSEALLFTSRPGFLETPRESTGPRHPAAIAAGLVTPSVLRGPRYLRLFSDTYVRRADEPPNLSVRSRAAGVYVAGRGVVSGYSAAELPDASCAPADAPAEVTVPDGGQRVLDLAYPEHLPRAPHRHRVRGRRPHPPRACAPRCRSVHVAGRRRLADVPVHEVRGVRRARRDRRNHRPRAGCEVNRSAG